MKRNQYCFNLKKTCIIYKLINTYFKLFIFSSFLQSHYLHVLAPKLVWSFQLFLFPLAVSVRLPAASLDCLWIHKFLRSWCSKDHPFCAFLLLPLEMVLLQKCPALRLLCYFLVLSPSLKEKENVSIL